MQSILMKAFVTPSLTAAMAWSSVIHVTVLVAGIFWLPAPTNNATLSGKTNVIQVQFTEQPANETQKSDVTIKVESPEAPTAPIANDTPFERPDAEVEPIEPQRVAMADVNVDQFHLDSSVTTKRKSVQPDATPQNNTNSQKISRQKDDVRPSTSLAAVPAIAGTDNKTPPDFTNNPPPPYPSEAIRRRIEGRVLLRVHVAASGRVQRVDVKESSGHSILDNAAASTISNWLGQPARSNGRPVATTELLPVVFRLRR